MRLRASLGTLWTNAIEIRAEHEANCHKCVCVLVVYECIWIMMMITLFTMETKWNAFDGVCSFHVAAVYTIPFESETGGRTRSHCVQKKWNLVLPPSRLEIALWILAHERNKTKPKSSRSPLSSFKVRRAEWSLSGDSGNGNTNAKKSSWDCFLFHWPRTHSN